MMTRRRLLQLSAAGSLALALPGIALGKDGIGGAPGGMPLDMRFRTNLPIPRVLAPVARDATTDYYEMTMRPGFARILPGSPTPIWGYEGTFPGPTIRARSGRQVVVRQTNALDVETAVHLHGGIVPSAMDGGPMAPIHPGESREYHYPNHQQAATLWYHDHAMDATGLHCWMGLCGFYLIEDDVEDALPLPKGAYDVPLAIADRRFDAENRFDYPAIEGDTLMYGALGDTLLVNGAVQPRFEVARRRYRFRILNASNARGYELALSSGQPFTQIGGDGGLLEAPLGRLTMTLAPAERLDVVIDFAAVPLGTRVVLRNLLGTDTTSDVMAFDVVRDEVDESATPAQLRPIASLAAGDATIERIFDFGFDEQAGRWLLNGQPYDHDRIDAAPLLGTTEIWSFRNGHQVAHDHGTSLADPGADFSHPIHLHGVFFQVLDRNGAPPPPWERGWKDTVSVGAGEEVRLLVRFDGYPGVFMYHCHKLEHEDRGMMGQFEIVGEDGGHGHHG